MIKSGTPSELVVSKTEQYIALVIHLSYKPWHLTLIVFIQGTFCVYMPMKGLIFDTEKSTNTIDLSG